MQKPKVPDSIQAPAGEELILMARATGFQNIYCWPDDAAIVVILSAVRRDARLAQYVPEGALARTEG